MKEERVSYGFRDVSPAEKRQLVDDHFAFIARRYDLGDTVLSFGLHHLWKRAAVSALGLAPGERLLDLCGGTADLALLAQPVVGEKGLVVVYDINRPMMEVGREKLARSGRKTPVRFVQGDAERMALPDNSFDAVIVGFGIRNLNHPAAGLAESFRVLRGGGRFVCLEFSMPVNPAFRWFYEVYSKYLMPVMGRMIAGSKNPYRYLHESVRVFPPPGRFVEMMTDNGFSSVSFRRLTNGIAVIYRGLKA